MTQNVTKIVATFTTFLFCIFFASKNCLHSVVGCINNVLFYNIRIYINLTVNRMFL